jgi:hypothetical protein
MVKPTQVVLIVRHKIAVVLNLAAAVLALVAMYNRSPEIGIASAICWILSSLVDLAHHVKN